MSCIQPVDRMQKFNVDTAQQIWTRGYNRHFCEIKISKFALIDVSSKKRSKNYIHVYPYIYS